MDITVILNVFLFELSIHCICYLDLNVKEHKAVAQWCTETGIDLVVVGPEDPLADGIVDYLTEQGLSFFALKWLPHIWENITWNTLAIS